MRKYLTILGLILLQSCYSPKGEKREKKEGYNIVTIENCEYIEVKGMLGADNGYYSLTHKGNCKNH
jgi:hypothetical protein